MLTDEEYVKSFLRDTLILVKLFGDQLNSIESLTAKSLGGQEAKKIYGCVMGESFHEKIAHSLTMFLDDLRKLINGCTFSLVTELLQDISPELRIPFLKDYIEEERRMKYLRVQLLQMTDSSSPNLDFETVKFHFGEFMRNIDFDLEEGKPKVAGFGMIGIDPIRENSLEEHEEESFEYDREIESFLLKENAVYVSDNLDPGESKSDDIEPGEGKVDRIRNRGYEESVFFENSKDSKAGNDYYTPPKTAETTDCTINRLKEESVEEKIEILRKLKQDIEPMSRKSYSFVSKIMLNSMRKVSPSSSIYFERINLGIKESNPPSLLNKSNSDANLSYLNPKTDSILSQTSVIEVMRARNHDSKNLKILENLPKCKYNFPKKKVMK